MVYAILKLSSIKPSKAEAFFLECTNLALVTILFFKLGLNGYSVIIAGVTAALLALSYTDIYFMKIFNQNVLVILILSLINVIISFNTSFLLNALAGMATGGGFFFIISIISKMGGGDIKLMGVLGLLLGFRSVVFLISLTFILAGIYAFFALLLKKMNRKSNIPLGPFISLGAYILFIFPKL